MLPPLPSLLLANVRSLENKLDELRARITTQREIRECCALIFTETWLSDKVPEDAIQLHTHSVHRGNRTAASETESTLQDCFALTEWDVFKAAATLEDSSVSVQDYAEYVTGYISTCVDNILSDVLTSIFNLSLSQFTVHSCFKTTTIIPLPKKSPPTCLNDYRPVALTPIIMKCFERVVLAHIQSSIPDTIDPLQYDYQPNTSTSDAIAAAIHYSRSHLENKDSYLRILFIDYSSAFNTVISHNLTHKLSTLVLHPTLCDWLLDFLTGRPQSVRIGNRSSARLITNIGTPQGCVLSPILYTLFTYDCVASHKDNIILKFADNTAVIGRIAGGDEAAYRREVASLVSWCGDNNLTLNTDKTKEIIVDMRKERRTHQPLFIRELQVERVSSFKYLGVHISEDLTWTPHVTQLVKKAQQRLYFLRRLRKFCMSPKILSNFYSCVNESVLTNCITVWYSSTTVMDQNACRKW
ncbi:hypothetical protein Q8A73_012505 [Channa argus]|nr:hypothetical protein Q8A73_012505 [Channa argus]